MLFSTRLLLLLVVGFISRYFKSVLADKLSESEIVHWNKVLVRIRDQILSGPEFIPVTNTSVNVNILLSGIVNLDFINNRWINYTKELPIVVIETSNCIKSIGNVMGSVYNSWSCAHFSGAHAIVLDRQDPKLSGIPERAGNTFFTAFPEIIVNPNAHKTRAEVLKDYKKLCPKNIRYPWAQSEQPIEKFIPYLRHIIHEPMRKQLLSIGISIGSSSSSSSSKNGATVAENRNNSITTTVILPQHQVNSSYSNKARMTDIPDLYDSLSAMEREQLPFYPDVTIHYRCSDNIFFNTMGLLQFHDIIDNIPSTAKYIFILTDDEIHTGRMNSEGRLPRFIIDAVVQLCRPVLDALAHDIQKAFPSAHVVVRRGGNGEMFFEILSMMMYSSTVICSTSTFCFHFAIMNPSGRVILPSWWFHGEKALNCCGNVEMLSHIQPVFKWIAPNGQVLNESTITVEAMLQILRNRTYHHHNISIVNGTLARYLA